MKKKIYCFEVASSTEWQAPMKETSFIPNTFVDISNTLNKKLLALKAYDLISDLVNEEMDIVHACTVIEGE